MGILLSNNNRVTTFDWCQNVAISILSISFRIWLHGEFQNKGNLLMGMYPRRTFKQI